MFSCVYIYIYIYIVICYYCCCCCLVYILCTYIHIYTAYWFSSSHRKFTIYKGKKATGQCSRRYHAPLVLILIVVLFSRYIIKHTMTLFFYEHNDLCDWKKNQKKIRQLIIISFASLLFFNTCTRTNTRHTCLL